MVMLFPEVFERSPKTKLEDPSSAPLISILFAPEALQYRPWWRALRQIGFFAQVGLLHHANHV